MALEISALGVDELAPNLGCDLVMDVDLEDLEQRVPLLRADMALVSLDKGEECLVPKNGKLSGFGPEFQEVEDDSVHNTVG